MSRNACHLSIVCKGIRASLKTLVCARACAPRLDYTCFLTYVDNDLEFAFSVAVEMARQSVMDSVASHFDCRAASDRVGSPISKNMFVILVKLDSGLGV